MTAAKVSTTIGARLYRKILQVMSIPCVDTVIVQGGNSGRRAPQENLATTTSLNTWRGKFPTGQTGSLLGRRFLLCKKDRPAKGV